MAARDCRGGRPRRLGKDRLHPRHAHHPARRTPHGRPGERARDGPAHLLLDDAGPGSQHDRKPGRRGRPPGPGDRNRHRLFRRADVRPSRRRQRDHRRSRPRRRRPRMLLWKPPATPHGPLPETGFLDTPAAHPTTASSPHAQSAASPTPGSGRPSRTESSWRRSAHGRTVLALPR